MQLSGVPANNQLVQRAAIRPGIGGQPPEEAGPQEKFTASTPFVETAPTGLGDVSPAKTPATPVEAPAPPELENADYAAGHMHNFFSDGTRADFSITAHESGHGLPDDLKPDPAFTAAYREDFANLVALAASGDSEAATEAKRLMAGGSMQIDPSFRSKLDDIAPPGPSDRPDRTDGVHGLGSFEFVGLSGKKLKPLRA